VKGRALDISHCRMKCTVTGVLRRRRLCSTNSTGWASGPRSSRSWAINFSTCRNSNSPDKLWLYIPTLAPSTIVSNGPFSAHHAIKLRRKEATKYGCRKIWQQGPHLSKFASVSLALASLAIASASSLASCGVMSTFAKPCQTVIASMKCRGMRTWRNRILESAACTPSSSTRVSLTVQSFSREANQDFIASSNDGLAMRMSALIRCRTSHADCDFSLLRNSQCEICERN